MYHIYIYQRLIEKDLEKVFLNLYDSIHFQYVDQQIMKISIEPSITEDWIDGPMLHASIVSDFDMDTTLIVLDSKALQFLPEHMIFNHIRLMKHQAFDITGCFIYFSRISELKQSIKRELVNMMGQDYINTILMIAQSNMNLSIAAKKLYLHRNSLNYRIEKIQSKTTIDMKSFSGLRALISIIE